MKECVVCGKMIKKVDSVMTTEYVCSITCKAERKKTLPKKVSSVSKSYWITQGYSEEEATLKVSDLQASRSPRHPSYWIKQGYTEEEANTKVKEVQSTNGKRNSEIYTKEELQARSVFSPVYWVNLGYTEEEANEIIKSNNSTVSLDAFIKRYGEDEGVTLYDEHCQKLKHTHSLDGYIEKYGAVEGELRWKGKYLKRGNSQAAENFFSELMANIPIDLKIHTASNDNGEYGIQNSDLGQYYLYDFVIPNLKVCVEFHGDYWHCNPKKYEPGYFNSLTNKTASEHWAHDQLKIDTMTKYRGYDTTVVWESEAKAKLPEVISMINERYAIVKAESPHLFEEDVSAAEPISENDT
jgi:hypothetical protein